MADLYLDRLPTELLSGIIEFLDLPSLTHLSMVCSKAQEILEGTPAFSRYIKNYPFSQVSSLGPPQEKRVWRILGNQKHIRTYACRLPPLHHPSQEANDHLLKGLVLLSEGTLMEQDKEFNGARRRLAICDKIVREFPPREIYTRNLTVTLKYGLLEFSPDQWTDSQVDMEGWRLILLVKEGCQRMGLRLVACGEIGKNNAYNTLRGSELMQMAKTARRYPVEPTSLSSSPAPLKIQVTRVDCYSIEEVKTFYYILENKKAFDLTVSQAAVFFPTCQCGSSDGCFGPRNLPISSGPTDKNLTIHFVGPHIVDSYITTYYLTPDDYSWHKHEGPSLDVGIPSSGILRCITVYRRHIQD